MNLDQKDAQKSFVIDTLSKFRYVDADTEALLESLTKLFNHAMDPSEERVIDRIQVIRTKGVQSLCRKPQKSSYIVFADQIPTTLDDQSILRQPHRSWHVIIEDEADPKSIQYEFAHEITETLASRTLMTLADLSFDLKAQSEGVMEYFAQGGEIYPVSLLKTVLQRADVTDPMGRSISFIDSKQLRVPGSRFTLADIIRNPNVPELQCLIGVRETKSNRFAEERTYLVEKIHNLQCPTVESYYAGPPISDTALYIIGYLSFRWDENFDNDIFAPSLSGQCGTKMGCMRLSQCISPATLISHPTSVHCWSYAMYGGSSNCEIHTLLDSVSATHVILTNIPGIHLATGDCLYVANLPPQWLQYMSQQLKKYNDRIHPTLQRNACFITPAHPDASTQFDSLKSMKPCSDCVRDLLVRVTKADITDTEFNKFNESLISSNVNLLGEAISCRLVKNHSQCLPGDITVQGLIRENLMLFRALADHRRRGVTDVGILSQILTRIKVEIGGFGNSIDFGSLVDVVVDEISKSDSYVDTRISEYRPTHNPWFNKSNCYQAAAAHRLRDHKHRTDVYTYNHEMYIYSDSVTSERKKIDQFTRSVTIPSLLHHLNLPVPTEFIEFVKSRLSGSIEPNEHSVIDQTLAKTMGSVNGKRSFLEISLSSSILERIYHVVISNLMPLEFGISFVSAKGCFYCTGLTGRLLINIRVYTVAEFAPSIAELESGDQDNLEKWVLAAQMAASKSLTRSKKYLIKILPSLWLLHSSPITERPVHCHPRMAAMTCPGQLASYLGGQYDIGYMYCDVDHMYIAHLWRDQIYTFHFDDPSKKSFWAVYQQAALHRLAVVEYFLIHIWFHISQYKDVQENDSITIPAFDHDLPSETDLTNLLCNVIVHNSNNIASGSSSMPFSKAKDMLEFISVYWKQLYGGVVQLNRELQESDEEAEMIKSKLNALKFTLNPYGQLTSEDSTENTIYDRVSKIIEAIPINEEDHCEDYSRSAQSMSIPPSCMPNAEYSHNGEGLKAPRRRVYTRPQKGIISTVVGADIDLPEEDIGTNSPTDWPYMFNNTEQFQLVKLMLHHWRHRTRSMQHVHVSNYYKAAESLGDVSQIRIVIKYKQSSAMTLVLKKWGEVPFLKAYIWTIRSLEKNDGDIARLTSDDIARAEKCLFNTVHTSREQLTELINQFYLEEIPVASNSDSRKLGRETVCITKRPRFRVYNDPDVKSIRMLDYSMYNDVLSCHQAILNIFNEQISSPHYESIMSIVRNCVMKVSSPHIYICGLPTTYGFVEPHIVAVLPSQSIANRFEEWSALRKMRTGYLRHMEINLGLYTEFNMLDPPMVDTLGRASAPGFGLPSCDVRSFDHNNCICHWQKYLCLKTSVVQSSDR